MLRFDKFWTSLNLEEEEGFSSRVRFSLYEHAHSEDPSLWFGCRVFESAHTVPQEGFSLYKKTSVFDSKENSQFYLVP